MLLTSEPSVIIDSYTNIPTRSTTADDQDRYPVPIDQQILQNSTTTTPSSASTDRLNGSTTDLIEQLWLTIRCLDDTVQLAQADDPIYSQLSLPISSIDGPELWSEIENTIDGLFDPDQGNRLIIRRGENGLERLISYIQLARQHPAWNGHDKLLEPKLNRLLKSVVDRCTQSNLTPQSQVLGDREIQAGHKCFPRSESLIDQADNTVVNDLPQTEPEDGQSNINREDNIDMDNVPRRRPVDRIIDEMEIDSNPSPSSRKRNSATVAHKLEVIDYHNRTGATQKQTANRFGLTQSQLSRWLKEEDELREYVMDKGSSSKRQRTGDFPQIEETLLRFFIESKSRNIAPSDDTLKQHTKAFMKLYGVSENALKVSNGWLLRFKGRNSIKSYVRPTHSLRFLDEQSINVREKLKAVTGSFALEDIYVAGEVSLFCNLDPLKKNTEIITKDKHRLTYLLCANADGSEKHQLHVIGQTQDSNVWQPKSEEKSFLYRYTTCGSITGPVFAEWIKKFDREMQRRKRKVLLLIDNFCGIVYDADALVNTTIQLVPSLLFPQSHPLCVGVIQTFKSNYRRRLVEMHYSPPEISLPPKDEQRVAIECALYSWDLITPATIQNCFKHTGIVSNRLSNGKAGLIGRNRIPEYINRFASDLDMETSLMATQSALIQLQRDDKFQGVSQITLEQFLSLEGEEDQKGRETMPSDEEIVNEAKFHSDQCREEAKKRKMDELEENNKSNNNKAKQNKGKIKKTTTVGPERQLNFNFTNNEGLLEMIPLSIQGMISSLENLEYSMPFYLSERSVESHLEYIKSLKQELRGALTEPDI